jgi:hypothetical protein
MSDENERSVASAGSHREPVAWAVEWKVDTKIDRSTVCYTEDAAKRKAEECPALDGVAVPLYLQPQPPLTDAEREAVEVAAEAYDSDHGERFAATLRGLLARLSPPAT